MHSNEHKPANEFLDSLASNSYLLYTIQPSRHTSHSKTLIDNFFSNVITKDIICGNITATISDHWPQFLVSPNTIANPPSNKSNAFERDWSKFDQENFILVYFHIDSVFLTRVSICQMPTWLPTWKAKSLYHVGTFLLTWFFVPLEKENDTLYCKTLLHRISYGNSVSKMRISGNVFYVFEYTSPCHLLS